MINQDHLEKLLILIEEICAITGNEWFELALQKKLHPAKGTSFNDAVFNNTEKIKEYLSLSPELSVDYSFISHKILRNRLELDNLRMENVRLNITEKDEFKRFFDYINFAFFQVENLVNYYYYLKYPEIEDLLDHIEGIDGMKFTRNGYHTNVGDIPIATKIFAFNKTFVNQPKNYLGFNIDNMRKVRNEGLHRCTILHDRPMEENNRLQGYLQHATYESVLNDLRSYTDLIKKNLE